MSAYQSLIIHQGGVGSGQQGRGGRGPTGQGGVPIVVWAALIGASVLAGVLVASKSEAVELHWNDQSRRFHKVECYEASERVRHLIGELRADASFAASEDALVQRKTNKRALS